MSYYLEEVDTLVDVDIDDDVDTELEVDTLTGKRRHYFFSKLRHKSCVTIYSKLFKKCEEEKHTFSLNSF